MIQKTFVIAGIGKGASFVTTQTNRKCPLVTALFTLIYTKVGRSDRYDITKVNIGRKATIYVRSLKRRTVRRHQIDVRIPRVFVPRLLKSYVSLAGHTDDIWVRDICPVDGSVLNAGIYWVLIL